MKKFLLPILLLLLIAPSASAGIAELRLFVEEQEALLQEPLSAEEGKDLEKELETLFLKAGRNLATQNRSTLRAARQKRNRENAQAQKRYQKTLSRQIQKINLWYKKNPEQSEMYQYKVQEARRVLQEQLQAQRGRIQQSFLLSRERALTTFQNRYEALALLAERGKEAIDARRS